MLSWYSDDGGVMMERTANKSLVSRRNAERIFLRFETITSDAVTGSFYLQYRLVYLLGYVPYVDFTV